MVDYDRKNFTVAQALFDDTAESNIVPIPWNATAPSGDGKGFSREAIIGISTGSAVFVLLVIILGVFATLRWRKRRNRQAVTDVALDSEDPPEVKPFSYVSIQEMGDQSTPEMHDTGYLELLDGSAPSGSDKVLNELADATPMPPCELFVPPTPNRHELASSAPSISPSSTSHVENPSPIDHVSPDSSPGSALSNTSKSPHMLQDTMSIRSDTRHPVSTPVQAPKRININKALPQEPLVNMPRPENYPSLRSRFGVEVPATAYKSKSPSLAQRKMSDTESAMAPSNSYGTISDTKESQYNAWATNRNQHGSFRIAVLAKSQSNTGW